MDLQSAVLHLVARPLRLPADARLLWAGVALSAACWAVVRRGQPDWDTAAGVALALTVALLYLRREEPRESPSVGHALLSLPALLAPAGVLAAGQVGRPMIPPSPVGAVLVLLGMLLALLSLWRLGRSFGVLPARRTLVTAGPYRWVRHPTYAGELLMLAGLCLRHATPLALAATVLLTGAVLLRIGLEERVLAADPAHALYRARVRYRLVPGVW